MAQCKVNKIKVICEKWNRKEIVSENAMKEIQKIIGLKESEMPPCTCKSEPEKNPACPLPQKPACPLPKKPACPLPQKPACPLPQKPACPLPAEKDATCPCLTKDEDDSETEECGETCPSLIRPPCPCLAKEEESDSESGECGDTCPSLIRPPCPCLTMEEEKSDSETEECGSCHSPGPSTINPFFNYMKELRETTCFNKTVVEVAKEAACAWRKMSECEKAPYVVEAYNVSRKKNKRQNSNDSCGCPSKVRKLD